ncbi:MAG: hypothetical protein IPM69_12085 [Ignavibacteria bacterium]|nr:hypothetical protein [Ignavibacteria bacterium]
MISGRNAIVGPMDCSMPAYPAKECSPPITPPCRAVAPKGVRKFLLTAIHAPIERCCRKS